MQDQLKPCPACASAELNFGVCEAKAYSDAMIWVQCLHCDIRGPAYPRQSKEKAIQCWNKMPRVLIWQRTPPTKAGFYFYRNFFGCIQVINVFAGMVSNWECDGEWAGPIPMPAK